MENEGEGKRDMKVDNKGAERSRKRHKGKSKRNNKGFGNKSGG